MTGRIWMTAAEAAAALGVTRATVYAYVSRGHIRSQAMPGSSRERAYSREDVERARRRAEERRHPETAAARALQWGMPILESSIALIDGERLYYRGHDAATLARTRSVKEVAALIWLGQLDPTTFADPLPVRVDRAGKEDLPFIARAQSLLAAAAADDALAPDLRAASVARCGWRILHVLTAAASGSAAAVPSIDQALARMWKVRERGVDVLRAALILCADHELNVSAFTARCVASAGSNPYAVVIAGLAALEGTRHGGATARVEAMLASMRSPDHRAARAGAGLPRQSSAGATAGRPRPLHRAIVARVRRGEPVDGFGHPLYPTGDPRAKILLALLRERHAKSAELGFILEFVRAASAAMRESPNVDFALAAVARVLRLPPGAPLTLFAIGRTIGWIGHAIEQYATGQLIRPRAKYVGVVPATP